MANTQECCEEYWTSPGGNTPQGTNYTATCLPSRKLYKLDEPDTQDTAGEARTNSSVTFSHGPPHITRQKQDDQLEHTYSSYVRIQDVALKTCQKWWMFGRSSERGPRISVQAGTPTHGRAKAGRPARTYIQQLCQDTGCCPEDLPWATNDREKWRERVRDIRATSTT